MNPFEIICEDCSFRGNVLIVPPAVQECPKWWICNLASMCVDYCYLGTFVIPKPKFYCPHCGSEHYVKIFELNRFPHKK